MSRIPISCSRLASSSLGRQPACRLPAPIGPKSLTLGPLHRAACTTSMVTSSQKILSEKLGVPTSSLPTRARSHVKLLDSGEAQLGLITMGVGLQGWNGTGD